MRSNYHPTRRSNCLKFRIPWLNRLILQCLGKAYLAPILAKSGNSYSFCVLHYLQGIISDQAAREMHLLHLTLFVWRFCKIPSPIGAAIRGNRGDQSCSRLSKSLCGPPAKQTAALNFSAWRRAIPDIARKSIDRHRKSVARFRIQGRNPFR